MLPVTVVGSAKISSAGAEISTLRAPAVSSAEALALLAECRQVALSLEKLYDLYEERISAFQLHPPGATWDGTFTATSK